MGLMNVALIRVPHIAKDEEAFYVSCVTACSFLFPASPFHLLFVHLFLSVVSLFVLLFLFSLPCFFFLFSLFLFPFFGFLLFLSLPSFCVCMSIYGAGGMVVSKHLRLVCRAVSRKK